MRRHEPVDVGLAGRFRAEDAQRRALGIASEHGRDADRHRDIDRSADDCAERLGAAADEQQVDVDAVLLEDAGAVADLGDGGVPCAALRHRHLQGILRPGGRRGRTEERDDRRKQNHKHAHGIPSTSSHHGRGGVSALSSAALSRIAVPYATGRGGALSAAGSDTFDQP